MKEDDGNLKWVFDAIYLTAYTSKEKKNIPCYNSWKKLVSF